MPVGGNAIAFEPGTNLAFIGGNASAQLTGIDVSSGKLVRTLPVTHSADLLWTNGKLFSADMKTGIKSVPDPASDTATRIKAPEVYSRFNYMLLPQACAGLMQLAAARAT